MTVTIPSQLIVLSAVIAGVIFAFDLLIPLGVAGGVPYVALVLLGNWFPRILHLYVLAAVGTILTILGYFLSPPGGNFWIIISNRALALFAIWITAFLIANRKGAEKALSGAAERVKAIVTNAVDGIITINSKGIVKSLNPAAVRMFGYLEDEIIDKNVSTLMPSHYASEHDGYIAKYLETGEAKIIGIGREVEGKRKDGSHIPLHLSISEFTSDGEQGFTGILHDISEKNKAEKELREKEEELRHISRLADMGQITSALAHEINQPLTAIASYIQAARRFLERGGDDARDKVYENLDKAVAQGTRAANIIRRLRQFIEKREADYSNGDINAIVEEACTMALIDAEQKGVRVRMNLGRNLPLVVMDKIQVQQVVVNLVRNSLDALMESERRELTVTTSAAENNSVEVAVSDTGPGLPDKVAKQLFKPFVTTKPDGMGVGLSICRSIIDEHGGRIWTTPNPGGGTIFCFTLPAISDTDKSHDQ